MNSLLCCTGCGGTGRVTLQLEPRCTRRCGRCKGRRMEPCAAPGCEHDAVTRVDRQPLCDADATLRHRLMAEMSGGSLGAAWALGTLLASPVHI